MLQDRKAKHLRRLSAPETVARLGRRCTQSGARLGTFEGVRERHGEQSSDRLIFELVQQAMQGGYIEAGSRRVVHQHPVFSLGLPTHRDKAVADRFGARCPAGIYRFYALDRADVLSVELVIARENHEHHVDNHRAVQRVDRPPEQRHACDRGVLLR